MAYNPGEYHLTVCSNFRVWQSFLSWNTTGIPEWGLGFLWHISGNLLIIQIFYVRSSYFEEVLFNQTRDACNIPVKTTDFYNNTLWCFVALGLVWGVGEWCSFCLFCFLFFKQFSLLWILVVQSLSCAHGKEISKSTECRTKLQLSSNNDFESVCFCLVVYWTLTVYFGPYKQHEDGWLLRKFSF